MGAAISFSELQDYLATRKHLGSRVLGVIIDTNVLIALTYEIKKEHEEMLNLINLMVEEELKLFVTVTTKSEFFDFHRRLLMTEGLLDLVDTLSQCRISERSRAIINSQKAVLRRREKYGRDSVFLDREIKEMKRSFSAGPHSGALGWLTLCREFLRGKLSGVETQLTALGIHYLSPNEPNDVFTAKPNWEAAMKITETSCISFSDSMILNILQYTNGLVAVSLDFDLGYATLSQVDLGDVLVPKRLKTEYRTFHFP